MTPLSSVPAFSWSHTRAQVFSDCRRRYYWQYYASNADSADAEARHAWALKQLVTLPMALGTAVHTCAKAVATAIREGRETPSASDLHRWVRHELNELWLSSHNQTVIQRDPAQGAMLQEIYYRDEIPPRVISSIRQRIRACVEHLLSSSVWAELRRCGPGDFLLLESPLRSQIDGITIYAVPDLAYRRERNSAVIVDFKTGQRRRGMVDQLALYALCLSRADGAHGITDWRGRICFLADGGESEYRLTPSHIQRALSRFRTSAAQMRQYLLDPNQNVPKSKNDFPVTEARERCIQCAYLELCAPELGIEDPRKREGASLRQSLELGRE